MGFFAITETSMNKASLAVLMLVALYFGFSFPVRADAYPASGNLIKASQPAVYYFGSDGKRYVFPNEKIYFSWYVDFRNIASVSDSELASIPIGGNVTYRPGVKLLKITTDPKVYAVDGGAVLRHVTAESLATSLYGSDWSRKVDDLSDAFFQNYSIGAPIASASDYSVSYATERASSINVEKGMAMPSTSSAGVPKLGTCQIFPSDNPWNQDISKLPVRADSQKFISSIGAAKTLHADFGGNGKYGMPFESVYAGQAKVPINFTAYGNESDPGPYPIPSTARIEGGADSDGDRHVLVLDRDACKLYELYRAFKTTNGWSADSGAIFDLKTNKLRPEGWTSADAAGLPIMPGLVKFEEYLSGSMNHAIRFTASRTQKGYIHPATHQAGINDASLPPMGLRVRLKADYDISKFTGQSRVILEAMKKYGMILADNGSDWFFQGDSDSRWNDDDLNQLKSVPGSAFEAVDTGPIIK